MLKVIYPLDSNIGKKRSAWRRLHELCRQYQFSAARPKLREETFNSNIIFKEVGGTPMTERRRVYTFTFYVEEQEVADKLIMRLCNNAQKLARLLTQHTMLLCLDENVAVRQLQG